MQDPGPPIWIGALTERARQRAVELADGFIFGGAARLPTIGPTIQSMRPQVAERGKPDFSFNAVAYVAIGGEPEFAEAVAHHHRYYPVLPVPAEQAIHHGPIGKIKDVVAEYSASGLNLLLLMPEVRSLPAAGAAFRAGPARIPALTRILAAGKSKAAAFTSVAALTRSRPSARARLGGRSSCTEADRSLKCRTHTGGGQRRCQGEYLAQIAGFTEATAIVEAHRQGRHLYDFYTRWAGPTEI